MQELEAGITLSCTSFLRVTNGGSRSEVYQSNGLSGSEKCSNAYATAFRPDQSHASSKVTPYKEIMPCAKKA